MPKKKPAKTNLSSDKQSNDKNANSPTLGTLEAMLVKAPPSAERAVTVKFVFVLAASLATDQVTTLPATVAPEGVELM